MKFNLKNIKKLLTNMNELHGLAQKFVNDGLNPERYGWEPARINYDDFCIDHKVNTACNCHPEYEWQTFASIEQFVEWLDKQDLTKKEQNA
jgi:hypothetical protein